MATGDLKGLEEVSGPLFTEVNLKTKLLPLAGGALTGATTAADHGTGTTDEVVNVCYGTSATPPTASGTTEGALYIQYTA